MFITLPRLDRHLLHFRKRNLLSLCHTIRSFLWRSFPPTCSVVRYDSTFQFLNVVALPSSKLGVKISAVAFLAACQSYSLPWIRESGFGIQMWERWSSCRFPGESHSGIEKILNYWQVHRGSCDILLQIWRSTTIGGFRRALAKNNLWKY
jgi:hypothetical protein